MCLVVRVGRGPGVCLPESKKTHAKVKQNIKKSKKTHVKNRQTSWKVKKHMAKVRFSAGK